MLKQTILYHGGDKEMQVSEINFNGTRDDCDFGAGFYLTPDRKVAEEWVRDRTTPVINTYRLTYCTSDVTVLEGSDWLKAVIGCREKSFAVKFTKNIVIGSIANDRMNDALPAFLTPAIFNIGDKRLFECLTLVKLGDQYVLKNNCDGLEFLESKPLKGLAQQQARERHNARRHDMKNKLSQIRRKQYTDEKFVEDYIEECKHGISF